MSDGIPDEEKGIPDEEKAQFWATHCWSKRFDGTPCAQPATWQGPQWAADSFSRSWRACGKHRVSGDVPLPATVVDA